MDHIYDPAFLEALYSGANYIATPADLTLPINYDAYQPLYQPDFVDVGQQSFSAPIFHPSLPMQKVQARPPIQPLPDYSSSGSSNFSSNSGSSTFAMNNTSLQTRTSSADSHNLHRRTSLTSFAPYTRSTTSKRPPRLNLGPQTSFAHSISPSNSQSYQSTPSPHINIAGLSLSPEDLVMLDNFNVSRSFGTPANYTPTVPMSAPAWQTSFQSQMPDTFPTYTAFPDSYAHQMDPMSQMAYPPVYPPRPNSAPLEALPMQQTQSQYSPTRPMKARPAVKRRVTSAPVERKSGGASFVNFTCADSKKLLTGVAPSGSSKRKREEEEAAARKRSSKSPETAC